MRALQAPMAVMSGVNIAAMAARLRILRHRVARWFHPPISEVCRRKRLRRRTRDGSLGGLARTEFAPQRFVIEAR